MSHGLKAARLHPALRLLVNVLPWQQVMGHHAPLAAATHDVAQRVEKLAQRIVPLGRILLHQSQVGKAKVPLCIADVTGIGGSWLVARRLHPKFITWTLNAVQHFLKLITGSNKGFLKESCRPVDHIHYTISFDEPKKTYGCSNSLNATNSIVKSMV